MDHRYAALYPSRPAEIELIRDMARGALTSKQKKKLTEECYTPPPNTKDAFIIRPAADWVSVGADTRTPDKLFGDFTPVPARNAESDVENAIRRLWIGLSARASTQIVWITNLTQLRVELIDIFNQTYF